MNSDNFDESTSRLRLFEFLAEANGTFVAGSFLTEKLHSSRQAVFKLVGALRKEGINIESIPQKGYMVHDIYDTDAMSPTLIDYLLKGDLIFNKCLYFNQITSTQHPLKKLALQNAPEGIVAVADEQTEGRGRRGRTWLAPAGRNLLFSVLLRPCLCPGDVQLLNLAAGIAVKNVLLNKCHVPAELKWPNDILVNGKKICGILSESAGESDRIYYAVTGIGLNVNFSYEDMSEDVKNIATSILIEKGSSFSRPVLLACILREFSLLLKALGKGEGKAGLLSAYREACATIGSKVSVIQDGESYIGTATDITEQGALIVNVNGNDIIFAAADVHHLRMN